MDANIKKYIKILKSGNWEKLIEENYPALTVEQIKTIPNDCVRMYLYCLYNHPEIYNYKHGKLLNRYIDTNRTNLLFIVCATGNIELFKYLCKFNLYADYTTLYYVAIYFKNIHIQQLIQKRRIDIYIKILKKGEFFRLLYFASYIPLKRSEIETIKEDNVKMYFYCLYNLPEIYNYKKKRLLNRFIDCGKTNILFIASATGNLEIVKHLIKYGVNINHKNKNNCDAYGYACKYNNMHIVKYLEKNNIDSYQNLDKMLKIYLYVKMFNKYEIYDHIENKFLYNGPIKICSICYENKQNKFITCNNNHVVHLLCHQKLYGCYSNNKVHVTCSETNTLHRCHFCSFKYCV